MSWKDSFKSFMRTLSPEDRGQFKKATEKMFEDEVSDLWTGEMHGVPSKETIPFGPGESASGKGAEVMVNTYSNPAPQQAITGEYDRLAREMGAGFAEARKAIHQLGKNQSAIKEVLGLLLKSEEEEEEDKKEEKAHEKAKSFMKKAKISIRKAESAEDEDEKEDGKDELEKAKISLKKAKELLFKAEEEEEDEEEVEKSFRDHRSLSKKVKEVETFLKESFKEWSKEEAEEPEHKKEVEKGKNKEEGDKGNQEAGESAEGNQEDRAAKSVASEMEKMVQKTVAEAFDTLMSRSTGKAPVFNIQKADPEAFIKAKRTAVEEAIMDDFLDLSEQGSADSILVALEKAHKGEIDQFIVEEKLRKAPAKVQSLFV